MPAGEAEEDVRELGTGMKGKEGGERRDARLHHAWPA